MYINKDKIGGFAKVNYWSSTEADNNDRAWKQDFDNGDQYRDYTFKTFRVRAVRSF